MQAINETNTRGQNKEKNLMLDVYKNISTFSGHLFKPNDEQPDAPDMHYSESGNFTDQERKGLKILTLNQILSRLPVSLAQLKAGNNSE